MNLELKPRGRNPSARIVKSSRNDTVEAAGKAVPGRTYPLTLLAVWPLLAFLPEFIFGNPSTIRIAVVLLLSGLVYGLLTMLVSMDRVRSLMARAELRTNVAVLVIVALHVGVFSGAIVLRHQYFGAEHGDDTAYYNQIFWSTLQGDFFRGSITQERYFDPPVSSEFAIHNSPILLLLLPFYSLSPSFYTLLILRNILLAASAIPLYLIAKDRIGGVAGIVVAIAYFASANIFYQAINGFYPLQLIALFLPLAFLYLYRQKFWPFLLCLVLCLSVREEIALTAGLFGIYALFLRRSKKWVIVPIVLSAAWWIVSTEFVMVRSRIAMEELTAFYEAFNDGHNGALATVIEDPGKFAGLLVTRENFAYLYELVKPTAGIALASPAVVFTGPTVAVNSLIGAFMGTMREISYHYSIVAVVCLFVALIEGLRLLSRYAHRFGVDRAVFCVGGSLLLIPGTALGVLDHIRFGGGQGQPLIAAFLPNPQQDTLEKIVNMIPADASVAAPGTLLPHLSNRKGLFIADRLWRYGDQDRGIQYIVLDTRLNLLSEADRNKPKYAAVIAKTRSNNRYELLLNENGFEVHHLRTASR